MLLVPAVVGVGLVLVVFLGGVGTGWGGQVGEPAALVVLLVLAALAVLVGLEGLAVQQAALAALLVVLVAAAAALPLAGLVEQAGVVLPLPLLRPVSLLRMGLRPSADRRPPQAACWAAARLLSGLGVGRVGSC